MIKVHVILVNMKEIADFLKYETLFWPIPYNLAKITTSLVISKLLLVSITMLE